MNIDIKNRNDQLLITGAGAGILAAGLFALRWKRKRKPRSGPFTPETLPKDAYDAVIVGAGNIDDELIVQGHMPITCTILSDCRGGASLTRRLLCLITINRNSFVADYTYLYLFLCLIVIYEAAKSYITSLSYLYPCHLLIINFSGSHRLLFASPFPQVLLAACVPSTWPKVALV